MKKDLRRSERRCRVCGCADDNCSQCIKKTGAPCHWVEEDLCSACLEGDKMIIKIGEYKKRLK